MTKQGHRAYKLRQSGCKATVPCVFEIFYGIELGPHSNLRGRDCHRLRKLLRECSCPGRFCFDLAQGLERNLQCKFGRERVRVRSLQRLDVPEEGESVASLGNLRISLGQRKNPFLLVLLRDIYFFSRRLTVLIVPVWPAPDRHPFLSGLVDVFLQHLYFPFDDLG